MLTEDQVNNLTWRELDFMYYAKELEDQMKWKQTREVLAAIINTQSKKKYKGKDIISLDKIDIQRKITKKDRRRIKDKVKRWGL